MEMSAARSNDGQVRVASGLNFLAGIRLIISPWIYGSIYNAGSAWNNIIVGIIIAVFAAIRFFSPRSAVALSWLNALLGIWMILSPWIYGYAANTARLWNSVIFGIIVVILAVWSASATRSNVAV
jgi:hypothetical protein